MLSDHVMDLLERVLTNEERMMILHELSSLSYTLVMDTSALLTTRRGSLRSLSKQQKEAINQRDTEHLSTISRAIETGDINLYITSDTRGEMLENCRFAQKLSSSGFPKVGRAAKELIDLLEKEGKIFRPTIPENPFYANVLKYTDGKLLDLIIFALNKNDQVREQVISVTDMGIVLAAIFSRLSLLQPKIAVIHNDYHIPHLENWFFKMGLVYLNARLKRYGDDFYSQMMYRRLKEDLNTRDRNVKYVRFLREGFGS